MKNYFSGFFKNWTGKIIALNIVIFAMMMGYNYFQEKTWDLSVQTLNDFGAVHPKESAWYTVVSMMFLHGGLAHIFCNSISLNSIGSSLEKYAKNWFLPVYFISGIVSGIVVYFFGYDWTVGASGAICGIWAMLTVYNLKYIRGKLMIVATMIDLSILTYISSLPKISALGHFSGFVTGLILGLIYFTYYFVDEEAIEAQKKKLQEDEENRILDEKEKEDYQYSLNQSKIIL